MFAPSIGKRKIDRHVTGQVGEFLVAAKLAQLGYSVAIPSGNAPNYDLLAYRNGRTRVVQVKCVSTGDLQLSLGKFLAVQMNGERQVITEVKRPSDPEIDFVIVFLAEGIDADRILCTKYGTFCEFIVARHRKALSKYDGKRSENPRNPKSLHAAYKYAELEKSTRFQSFPEFFA